MGLGKLTLFITVAVVSFSETHATTRAPAAVTKARIWSAANIAKGRIAGKRQTLKSLPSDSYAQFSKEYNVEKVAKKLAGHTCSSKDTDRMTCMACNTYFESRGESYEGKIAVGRTVMTRLFSLDHPSSVCKIVWATSQFSWTMMSQEKLVLPKDASKLENVVKAAKDSMEAGPNGFLNFYAPYIANPPWASSTACRLTTIMVGNHAFCQADAWNHRSVISVTAAEGINISTTKIMQVAGDSAD
jgi:spore germination cell wall hydrolase CwlJ-like protein